MTRVKFDKQLIVKILLTVLISYTIIFPADRLNIKEILLAITLVMGYFGKRIHIDRKIVVFGVLFPLATIVYSLIRGNDLGNALSFGYVWAFILLIPIIRDYNYNIKNAFLVSTYVVAIIIDIIMLADLFGIVPIRENGIASFFISINEIQGLGKGIVSTIGYSIFYKSCPLIILSYAYYVYNKKVLKSLPLFLALFACGTRANFIVAIILTMVIPAIYWKSSRKSKAIFILVMLLAIALLPIAYNKLTELNSIKSINSDAVKIEDSRIIINDIKSSPLDLLLGTGVGSCFMSSRGHEMMTYEISAIDYLRQTGIVGITVLIIFIGFIVKSLKKRKQYWILVSIIGYVAVAFTNPLLVTSTSFMAYLFAICYNEEFEKKPNIRLEDKSEDNRELLAQNEE